MTSSASRRRSETTATHVVGESPRRRRMGLEERRAQLVELGIEAFSEKPYDLVSVDGVAASAGISKGLLYHYFPTKRHFYVATIAEVAKRLVTMTDFSSEPLPLVRLTKGLDAYCSFIENYGRAYAGLLRAGIGVDAETLAIIENTRTVFVERLVSGLENAVSPLAHVAMRGFIGFVESTSLDWIANRSVSREELIGLWTRSLVVLAQPFLAEDASV